eukprot:CAMPEP_0204324146 /NCGR_PEP_ID=MMETSP0469-20131031/9998_1 /ASSEMBLY_ACC=CAM_ASM_000384 /TAXON_ID=2969 /ORGANISM="Oxyrrhis marina" /LENGTH=41 /DNA_ID= /DNA_START= /DNA_END= /DNA_ORIENTATION=
MCSSSSALGACSNMSMKASSSWLSNIAPTFSGSTLANNVLM